MGKRGKLITAILLALVVICFLYSCLDKLVTVKAIKPNEEERCKITGLMVSGNHKNGDSVKSADFGRILKIPLTRHWGKYFIQVKVNGQAADFLFDWGGGGISLSPYMALKAKATLYKSTELVSTIDTTEVVHNGRIDELVIKGEQNDVTLTQAPFTMLNNNLTVYALHFIPVYKFKGLAGIPLIAGFKKFTFDMQDNILWLGKLEDDLTKNPNTLVLNCRYINGIIAVNATADGLPCSLTVDISGDNSKYKITLQGMVAKTFMKVHSYEYAGEQTGFGDGGAKTYSSVVSLIKIGNDEEYNVPVLLQPGAFTNAPDSSGDECQGVIGNTFFKNCEVGADLTTLKLYCLSNDDTITNNLKK